jgi:hypothetical protein
MSNTTYHIIACMEGTLSVVGETTDPNKTIRDVIGRVSNPRQVQIAEPPPDENTPPQPTPICGVHDVPVVWQKGRAGFFWSCHQKNLDGSWCSYKAAQPSKGAELRPRGNGLGGPGL